MIGFQPPNTTTSPPYRHEILTILDTLIACVIVSPCVVGYWRSVWTLMDIHVLPDQNGYSALISFIIGYGGHVLFCMLQKIFAKYIRSERRLLFYIISRLYTGCFGIVCVNGWRGPWLLIFNDTDQHINIVWTVTGLSVIALACLRALKNVSAPPCMIGTDGSKGYFDVLTAFRTVISENFFVYTLDCLFSVFVIGTLVVFVWRGAWVLLDIYVYPHDDITSAWCSLILGYTAIGIAFLLQPLMRWICDRLNGILRIIIADVYILFALIGTINIWRGIWNLLDHYFLPDRKELGCWITHVGCFGILVLLGCSNSLLVRGVYIDAEEPAGECVIFPCHYLRVLFQDERRRSGFDVKPVIEQNQMVNMNNTNHVDNNAIVENSVKDKHDIVL